MTTWKLDKAHTQINFSAKHPTRSFGEFKVATASVDTNFGARDTHLRSADFFDVEQHPYLTFVSTKVEQTGDDQFKVTGDLTIREITKPVTFDVELDGIVKGMRGGRHAGLSAKATLARADWDLNWNVALEQGGWLVGKEIKLDITVAADEVATEQQAELAASAS